MIDILQPDGKGGPMLTIANAETDKQTAPISPTGAPVLSPKFVPWLALAVGVAALLPMVPGLPPVVATVCGVVVALGAALGIASPGVRK